MDRLIEMIGLMVDRFDRVDRLIVDGMNRLMEWIGSIVDKVDRMNRVGS